MNDSIYPSSKLNERSVGKRFKKPHAHKEKIKLTIHPCSIPTKFHTIHYDDNEEKGFDSSTKRFNNLMNDLPGPGYYDKEKNNQLMLQKATNFGSKQARFKNITTNTWDAKRSPAYYNPKDVVYSANETLSPAFRMPIASTNHFKSVSQGLVKDRWGFKPAPGPGSYDLFSFKNQTKSESSVFKSRTHRGSFMRDDLPPPGAYEPFAPPNLSGAQAAFKGTSRSIHIKSSLIPGPGTYERDPVRQGPRKIVHFKLGTIAQSHGFIKQTSSKIPKDEIPGPGNYEVAKASEKIHKAVPIATLGYLPRFIDLQKRIGPGPGDYQASETKLQSFHLNIESIWI